MNNPEPSHDFYEAFLEQMQPQLFGYILSLLASPSDAKDVLQETNQVVLRKVGELRQADRFNAWAFRIAYYQSLSFLKKRKRERLSFGDGLLENLAATSERLADENERRFDRLEQCVQRLQDRARLVVSDYYYKKRSLRAIAADRELVENHVAQILYRARKALRDCMIQSEKSENE